MCASVSFWSGAVSARRARGSVLCRGTEDGMSFPLLLLGKAACLAVLLPPKASVASPAPLLSLLEC